MINKERFLSQVDSVIAMNHLFRDTIEQDKIIPSQIKFTQDEIEETISRGVEKFDKIEFVDGLGDVFVTASFLEYLFCDGDADFHSEFERQFNYAQKEVMSMAKFFIFLEEINHIRNKGKLIFNLVCMFNYVNQVTQEQFKSSLLVNKYDNLMDWVVSEVNQSNMSKFPFAQSKTEMEILADIKKVKAKVGHDNVEHIVKNGRIIYLDMNNQKFQKPTTFIEPDLQLAGTFTSLEKFFY